MRLVLSGVLRRDMCVSHLEEGICGIALLQVGSKVPVALSLLHSHQQRPQLLEFCCIQCLEPQLLLFYERHLVVGRLRQ